MFEQALYLLNVQLKFLPTIQPTLPNVQLKLEIYKTTMMCSRGADEGVNGSKWGHNKCLNNCFT